MWFVFLLILVNGTEFLSCVYMWVGLVFVVVVDDDVVVVLGIELHIVHLKITSILIMLAGGSSKLPCHGITL